MASFVISQQKSPLNDKTFFNSTLDLFKSFSQEQLARIGNASGHDILVRAIGIMIIAHQERHQKVFQERYL